MAASGIPELDGELRRRLGRRYGSAIEPWLDELPPVLGDLSARWQLECGALIQRGSMSVLIRCRAADGRPAVLKVGPERERLAREAAVLARWKTTHAPRLLAVDERAGALLIEAVEPGTPLSEAEGYPSMESLIDLITALHADREPDASYPSATERVAYLFDSSTKLYERRPDLVELIPRRLYERGRELALRLAESAPTTVLLHGDLTPVNVLDGGERGLLAIDPAACWGDPAFDAIDLILWRAGDADVIATGAERLAPAIGADTRRLLDWCAAFAGMAALEKAEAAASSRDSVETFVSLAARA